MKRFAFTFTLVLLLVGSAVAQSAITETPDPGLWGGRSLNVPKMAGIEVSPGTIDYMDSICWGRTFLMMSESGSFTLMPNYTVDVTSEPSEYYSKITSGAWTLSYKASKLSGMLFGEVTSGTIEWHRDKAGNIEFGDVVATIMVKGGTGSFANDGGKTTFGTFTGVIDYSSGSPLVHGNLDLVY